MDIIKWGEEYYNSHSDSNCSDSSNGGEGEFNNSNGDIFSQPILERQTRIRSHMRVSLISSHIKKVQQQKIKWKDFKEYQYV